VTAASLRRRLGPALLLLGAATLWAACYSSPSYAPPQGYGQQGQGWSAAGAAAFFCATMESPATRGSVCFSPNERCDDESRAAQADGLAVATCVPQSPVACFQLGDDPSPSMEMCAATIEDCDLLRLIDHDKNGRTGPACEWRHGPGTAGL
jgi:hypothetical protein